VWWLLLLPSLASAEPPPERLLVRLERGVVPADVGGRDWLPVVRSRQHRDPAAFERSGLGRTWVVESTDIARWARTPGVEYAEWDAWGRGAGVPDDPGFATQWGLLNDGSNSEFAVAGADIDAAAAWDIEEGDPSVVVAVLDTGFILEQPDVQLWTNAGENPNNGIDDDGNGYIDDRSGWDFVQDDRNPRDATGHGTNVSAIAVAEGNNGLGLTGVCPGCRLMIGRNLGDDGFGQYSWWIESMAYAVDNGASVLNMSEGGLSNSITMRDAAQYAVDAGVPIVAAMMNTNDDTPYYPAAYEPVIAVGATNDADERAAPFVWGGGSNYGDHIDLVAPGNSIAGFGLDPESYDSFWSGTSQAAPHVAGLLGLMRARAPHASPAELRQVLRDAAVDEVGPAAEDAPGWDRFFGWGRVDAPTSLKLLSPDDDGDDWSVLDGDCDDDDASVNPGAEDLPGDGVDSDCDGIDPAACWQDLDRDGFGFEVPETGLDGTCDADGLSATGDDCDDLNNTIFPGADEACGDEVDQDCDGADLACPEDDDDDGGQGCSECGTGSGSLPQAMLWLLPMGLVVRRGRRGPRQGLRRRW